VPFSSTNQINVQCGTAKRATCGTFVPLFLFLPISTLVLWLSSSKKVI